MSDRCEFLEWYHIQMSVHHVVRTLEDGAAADQAVGGVMATKPLTGMGHESGSPEMDTETRVQALRGAAGTKPPQCTQVRWGYLECYLKKVAFPWSK